MKHIHLKYLYKITTDMETTTVQVKPVIWPQVLINHLLSSLKHVGQSLFVVRLSCRYLCVQTGIHCIQEGQLITWLVVMNSSCVKAMKRDPHFGPHWLLLCRLCEEFGKSELQRNVSVRSLDLLLGVVIFYGTGWWCNYLDSNTLTRGPNTTKA